jgi:hypothetical protein
MAVALSGFLDLTPLADPRLGDPASMSVGIVLSAIGLGALSASTWLGDEPIRVHKA